MRDVEDIGADWLAAEVEDMADRVVKVRPSDFNEEHRYLPASVTPMPGFIRYDVNPYMREIVDCFDIDSPVREVNLMKGVQITYTTVLESGLLYFMGHVKTAPSMFMTADKELAKARIENNVIPMLQQSGFADIIRSSDEGNTRKTGKTATHLQWEGGGYLIPFGAQNANKMRSFSIQLLLKDEIDAWPDTVGKDGDPDALSDARCSAYWDRRKIFRGSTPLIAASSKIQKQYKRGDQRKYMVLCKACGFPQELRWNTVDKETGVVGGFTWELTADGMLIPESVAYRCQNCSEPHYEHDKERLFHPDHGAHWKPTAVPVEPGIRSYHLPAMYSPIGMQPWAKCVADYLEGWDPVENKVRDIGKYQVFYNNILAEPFVVMGSRIAFTQVSLHRRAVYRLGQIPNEYAREYSGGPILFLTCQVDVHKSNLAVTVMGWTAGQRCYVIEYLRLEDDDCTERSSKVWGELQEIIEERRWTADDGREYWVGFTVIDAGYSNDTVTDFCSQYAVGVYPVLGRDRPGKNQTIKEFSEFKAQDGTVGYKIVVDHYKDRNAPVLRREWSEQAGEQREYHFNAPVDITDKQLKELTVETRREKVDDRGYTSYYWHRPGNAANELWDLLQYGHAAVEIIAWQICINYYELERVEWPIFWAYMAENGEGLYWSPPES